MSGKAEIREIVLDLGGKTVKLTPEQARKLHAALDDIYGTKEQVTFVRTYPVVIRESRPCWEYERPIYTSGDGVQFSFTDNNAVLALSM